MSDAASFAFLSRQNAPEMTIANRNRRKRKAVTKLNKKTPQIKSQADIWVFARQGIYP